MSLSGRGGPSVQLCANVRPWPSARSNVPAYAHNFWTFDEEMRPAVLLARCNKLRCGKLCVMLDISLQGSIDSLAHVPCWGGDIISPGHSKSSSAAHSGVEVLQYDKVCVCVSQLTERVCPSADACVLCPCRMAGGAKAVVKCCAADALTARTPPRAPTAGARTRTKPHTSHRTRHLRRAHQQRPRSFGCP